jgi:hypothetical protein
MWILPKKYQMSCRYAQDTVASKEDLSLPGLSIESSLMWKSRPSQLPTWLRRWNKGGWFRHLSGRILKPCQWTAFETELTLSLGDTRVSPSQQQGSEQVKTTPDTSGRGSDSMWTQLDLLAASSRTSRDTSVSDSERSLATWKALVTQRRGEYSARLKSARLIKESESTSWPTPTASDSQGGPRQMDGKRGRALKDLPNPAWPTPTTQDANKATKKMRDDHQNNLTAVVFHQETFPSPTARDWKGGYTEAALTRKDGKSRRFDALPNAAIGGVGTDIKAGHLNPDWVEWLMGVPTGWTDLGSWETE